MNKKRPIKVVYVVCYRDPNYIRSQTIINALKKIDYIDLVVVKNKRKGLLRYFEVPIKLLWTRLTKNPKLFIVGFRGHEVFWLLYPSMVGKKVVFDEFINLHSWLVNEHAKLKEGSWQTALIDRYMKWVFKKSYIILEDTEAHAKLSTEVYGTATNKLLVLPVGADEATFFPRQKKSFVSKFEVFFFGNMLPLHGLDVMLEAIKILVAKKNKTMAIHFTLVGGRGDPSMIHTIQQFIKANKLSAFVTHKEWVNYNDLPDYIERSDLCLGGPFGNTPQAKRVITGKTYQFIAMGKPVVIGGNHADHRFKDKKNCIIVKLGDAVDLANSILWAATNKQEIKKIGQSARQLYEEHYSSQTIAAILSRALDV